jgi:F-type H+-transporting ATPase subunit epsilon
MNQSLQLDVVTPERRVLSEAVNSITVPGRNGECKFCPVTRRSSPNWNQRAHLQQDGTGFQLHVSGGFMEVNNDRVSVLAEIAGAEEIDATRPPRARTNRKGIKFVGGLKVGESAGELERSIVDCSWLPAPVKHHTICISVGTC